MNQDETGITKLGCVNHDCGFCQPKREWVWLTGEELKQICAENHIMLGAYAVDFIRAIEAKLKEKNT